MKVTLTDGKTLHLRFTVEHPTNKTHVTTCYIEIPSEDGSEPPIKVFGMARCHPNDRYDKASGKVTAMERALEMLDAICDLSRQDRKRIWARFYQHMANCPDIQRFSGYGEYLHDGAGQPCSIPQALSL